MICPQCAKEGKKSRVAMGMSTCDLVYRPVVYDEDGNLIPRESGCTTDYSCSNGHRWKEKN